MFVEVKNLTIEYETRKIQSESGIWRQIFLPGYESRTVLQDLSFTIDSPGITAFLGKNGAGKTTLLKALTGLLTPKQGSISVNGYKPIQRKDSFLRSIGVVFGQKRMLWPELSFEENLKLTAALYLIPSDEVQRRIQELVDLFQIGNLSNRPVRSFSLGESMKAEIANILLFRPKVLFLDEPTIGLDLASQVTLRNALMEYRQRWPDCHILLTSHNLQDVEVLAQNIAFLEKGQLQFIDPKMGMDAVAARLLAKE